MRQMRLSLISRIARLCGHPDLSLSPTYVADSVVLGASPDSMHEGAYKRSLKWRSVSKVASAFKRFLCSGGMHGSAGDGDDETHMPCLSQEVGKASGIAVGLAGTTPVGPGKVGPMKDSVGAAMNVVTGRPHDVESGAHFLVMATSERAADVLAQLLQFCSGMTCYCVESNSPPYLLAGPYAHIEERFKDVLHLSMGILSVCREKTEEAVRFFTDTYGVVNLVTGVYVSVHHGEEAVAIHTIKALLKSGLDENKLHIVCFADDRVADVSSFHEFQAFVRANPRLNGRVHAKVIPGCALLTQIARMPTSIGDLLRGTHDFLEEVERERSKGPYNISTYKALDGLMLQYRLEALRPALLDALQGLTPVRITST
ncbi:hypothetical protein [Paraburkholderia terrae]|uniref:hypothetical protein n=1 Tax=Paraburkholderia terrae TaxID=311230 RepID=UPI0020651816|nr:hypothetical protein [Paraburkholderia terrae]BDC39159.1 hypothetical protein PTKU15_24560 [Paraburkholderia terrae]